MVETFTKTLDRYFYPRIVQKFSSASSVSQNQRQLQLQPGRYWHRGELPEPEEKFNDIHIWESGQTIKILRSNYFPSKLSLVSLDLSAPRKRNEHQGHGSFEVSHIWKFFRQMSIKDSSKWSCTEFSFHQSKSKVEEKLRGRFTLKNGVKGTPVCFFKLF